MMFIVCHSNIICLSVKMSTLGLHPRVDILTSGHITVALTIMHHLYNVSYVCFSRALCIHCKVGREACVGSAVGRG